MSARRRDEEGYLRFAAYLGETGLLVGARVICLRHAVTPRDIYLDGAGPTTYAARLEIWHWLSTLGKSPTEIARMFDRDDSSIRYALGRLAKVAEEMGAELGESSDDGVARIARAVASKTNDARIGNMMRNRRSA